jgi:hypothetical protein
MLQSNRLLALDWAIAKAMLSILLRNWKDLPYLLILGAMALAALMSIFRLLPTDNWAQAAAAIGAVFGLATGRYANRRIATLRDDSHLAAEAHNEIANAQYLAAYFLLSFAGLSLPFLNVSWQARLWGWLGFLLGAALSMAFSPKLQVARIIAAVSRHQSGLLYMLRQSPAVLTIGVISALTATVAEHAFRYDGKPMTGMGVTAFTIVAILLTPVDYGIARFQRLSGFSVWLSVKYFLVKPFVALLIGVGVASVTAETFNLILIAAAASVVFTYRLLQVIVFRLYGPRSSEWVLVIAVTIIMIAGFAVPYLIPFIIGAILLLFGFRSENSTWLMKQG